MSKPYIVTYDLNKVGQKYEDVYEKIKQCGISYAHYLDSTWLIRSNKTSYEIFETIKPTLDVNDDLMVFEISKSDYTLYLIEKQRKFIEENILY